MSRPSRLDAVRRRLTITRYAIGVLAAGALAGGAVVARAAHPGSHGSHRSSASVSAAVPGESSSVLAAAAGLGNAAVPSGSNSTVSPAPAAAPPVAQSAGS
jgi:hypothetical protein